MRHASNPYNVLLDETVSFHLTVYVGHWEGHRNCFPDPRSKTKRHFFFFFFLFHSSTTCLAMLTTDSHTTNRTFQRKRYSEAHRVGDLHNMTMRQTRHAQMCINSSDTEYRCKRRRWRNCETRESVKRVHPNISAKTTSWYKTGHIVHAPRTYSALRWRFVAFFAWQAVFYALCMLTRELGSIPRSRKFQLIDLRPSKKKKKKERLRCRTEGQVRPYAKRACVNIFFATIEIPSNLQKK